jgi:hypothetical protein
MRHSKKSGITFLKPLTEMSDDELQETWMEMAQTIVEIGQGPTAPEDIAEDAMLDFELQEGIRAVLGDEHPLTRLSLSDTIDRVLVKSLNAAQKQIEAEILRRKEELR